MCDTAADWSSRQQEGIKDRVCHHRGFFFFWVVWVISCGLFLNDCVVCGLSGFEFSCWSFVICFTLCCSADVKKSVDVLPSGSEPNKLISQKKVEESNLNSNMI